MDKENGRMITDSNAIQKKRIKGRKKVSGADNQNFQGCGRWRLDGRLAKGERDSSPTTKQKS